MSWKRLNRKTLIASRFLKVYEDSVELPNGINIPDYTVVEKPNFVMVVATDETNRLITIDEYKYAINATIHTLPAGHIEPGEDPLTRAKKELFEETGFTGGKWVYLGEFYDYASKDSHRAHFVRAINVKKEHDQHLEATESIQLRVVGIDTLKEEINRNEWRASATLAALVAAKILQ